MTKSLALIVIFLAALSSCNTDGEKHVNAEKESYQQTKKIPFNKGAKKSSKLPDGAW